jgi:hypothetical protein
LHGCFDQSVSISARTAGEKAFLALPKRGTICDGHCLILPVTTAVSCKACDEVWPRYTDFRIGVACLYMAHTIRETVAKQDVYAEVCRFKANLQDMFFAVAKQEVIFIEHVSPLDLKQNRHFALECIPLPRAVGECATRVLADTTGFS